MTDFHPTRPRFAVFDGEKIVLPGDEHYGVYKIDVHGTVRSRFPGDRYATIRDDCAPLLSTGLHDADGAEVFDGSLVNVRLHRDGDVMGAYEEFDAICPVSRHRSGAWWLTIPEEAEGSMFAPSSYLLDHLRSARVVGHALTHPDLLQP